MYRYILLLVTLFLLTACANKSNVDDLLGNRVSFAPKSEFKFSDIISDIHFVALELTDESSFMYASQILCNDKYIVIFDFDTDKLLKFDKNGKFLGKIGNRGQGPNEYAKITSVCMSSDTLFISDNHDETLVYDLITDKIVDNYNYFNFNIIRRNGLFVGSDYVSADDVDKTNQLYFYDSDRNLKSSTYKSRVKSGYMVSPLYRFYDYNNNIFYYPPNENAIYEISGDSCLCHVIFDFGQKKFNPISVIEENTTNQTMVNYWMNNDEYIHSFIPFETTQGFVVNYWCASTNYVGIYSRSLGKGFHLEMNKKDNIENPDFMNRIVACKGDTLVATTNMKSLRNISYYNCEPPVKDFLDKSTTIDDENDVLVFFTIK